MKLSPATFKRYAVFILSLILLGSVPVFALHYALDKFGVTLPWWAETITSTGIAGSLFSLFHNNLWAWGIFKRLGLIATPDLRGRWMGELRSSHDEMAAPVTAALEIRQTASSVLINLYTEQSQSSSIVANFGLDADRQYALRYAYENRPRRSSPESMQTHQGYALLRYHPEVRELRGNYFTSTRDRNTYGTMHFEFNSNKVLGRLE